MRLTVLRLATVVFVLFAAASTSKAQQDEKTVKIGRIGGSSGAVYRQMHPAFDQALREFGYIEGRNLTFEVRYAEGKLEHLPALARELVQLSPDLIVAPGDQAITAVKAATTTIPIVMVACDALAAGLVDSLARPSGNLTGVTCISAEIAAKRLEILRELRPGLRRVGILWNPQDPGKAVEWRETQKAARALGIERHPEEVRDATGLGAAFSRLKSADALIVLGDAFTIYHRSTVTDLARTHRIVAMYGYREFVDVGGLMSYGSGGRTVRREDSKGRQAKRSSH